MEQYKIRILAILDEAAGNNDLSTEDYMDLCYTIRDEADSRGIAAGNDLLLEEDES